MENQNNTQSSPQRTPKQLSFVIEQVIEQVLEKTKGYAKTSPNYFTETEKIIDQLATKNQVDPEHIFNIMFGSRREVEMLINSSQIRMNLD